MHSWDPAYLLLSSLLPAGITALIFGERPGYRLMASFSSGALALAVGTALLLAKATPALAALAGLATGLAYANALLDLLEGLVADIASVGIAISGLGASLLMALPGQTLLWALLVSLAGGLLAALILWGVSWFYKLRRCRPGLGSGDVILAAAAGTWSGLPFVGPSLLIACTATLLLAMLTSRLGERIPFAPGLVLGFGATFAVRFSTWPDFLL
jgi:leader peptidase (prepilin peptidase)/N-methyltransferase